MERSTPAVDLSLLTCKICTGNLKETQITLCCVNRFCKSCITNFLKVNSKQCPSCRKTINEDYIRADANFDVLVALNLPKSSSVKEEPQECKNEIFTVRSLQS